RPAERDRRDEGGAAGLDGESGVPGQELAAAGLHFEARRSRPRRLASGRRLVGIGPGARRTKKDRHAQEGLHADLHRAPHRANAASDVPPLLPSTVEQLRCRAPSLMTTSVVAATTPVATARANPA